MRHAKSVKRDQSVQKANNPVLARRPRATSPVGIERPFAAPKKRGAHFRKDKFLADGE